MHKVSLNGKWKAYSPARKINLPALVPGDVYRDLLHAKQIPDPYYRDNEQLCQWVGESDWTFSREFTVAAELLSHEQVKLRCHGLDTVARIMINQRLVGTTDNMFRVWEFDVKRFLKAGRNTIHIHFTAPLDHAKALIKSKDCEAWDGKPWLRKEPCNFGWDWGLSAVTSGIWRDIELLGYTAGRLTDVEFRQDHRSPKQVKLAVALTIEQAKGQALTARVSIGYGKQGIDQQTAVIEDGQSAVPLIIKNPHLWWPNNMGEQALYDVVVELLDAAGQVLDTWTRRIGLRTLRLDRHKDSWGESFQFVVNGVPFFAKGANWIPADAILARMDEAHYRMLLEASAAANMNMLRVWGGGIYEHDVFYTICDELGICVWQDFMFACSPYPAFDEDFMQNVEHEARDNVRRLRHHACMALWCGNNELEQMWGPRFDRMGWEAYCNLFDKLLPGLVKELHPDCDYWPASPHSPHGDRRNHNNPGCGDAHLWDVWHGGKPFEWYRTCEHRFNSEFGFQSFPEPQTVYGYTVKEDRNISSRIMDHHQRSWNGNKPIIQYMLDWYRMPQGFENTLWTSQILQGMAIKYAVEHWRRSMPRGMGTLYWQLNDCWPVASWSSIDFHGRWKALHYMAAQFFAPVLISGLEDMQKGTLAIHLTSDRLKTMEANIAWEVTDLAGKRLAAGAKKTRTPVNGNRKVETLRLKSLIEKQTPYNVIVWLTLIVPGEPVQRNMVLFARPKHLELVKKPGISSTIKSNKDGSFAVTLKSKHPALWTWLEIDGTNAGLSGNFFHLRPGMTETVIVCPQKAMTRTELKAKMVVRSLVDTY